MVGMPGYAMLFERVEERGMRYAVRARGAVVPKQDLAWVGAAPKQGLAWVGAVPKQDLAWVGAEPKQDLAWVGAEPKQNPVSIYCSKS